MEIKIIPANELAPHLLAGILDLCSRAYEEELSELFATFSDPVHVICYLDGVLASHAMWVTRWLQVGNGSLLRTAYVEMVATEPRLQRRGCAGAVLRRLADAITGYQQGALSPSEPGFYARLGWTLWRGPLLIRSPEGLLPTADEQVMILPLPKTPALDLDLPLSAEWREGELW